MPSKYKKLRDKLPAYEPDASFQDKVNKFKAALGANAEDASIPFLARKLAETEKQKELHETAISELNVALEGLEQMLAVALKGQELDSTRLDGGSTVYLQYEVYPSVKDKEALNQWCSRKGLKGLYTLPWQTLKGICSELSLDGKPAPSGVKLFIKECVRIRDGSEKS